MDGRAFCRLFDSLTVTMTNVTGVLIIAGVGIVIPIWTAIERRALLDLRIRLTLPQQARNNAARIFIRCEVPTVKNAVCNVEIVGNRIEV